MQQSLTETQRCVEEAGFEFSFSVDEVSGGISNKVSASTEAGVVEAEARRDECLKDSNFAQTAAAFNAEFRLSEQEIDERTRELRDCARAEGIELEDTDNLGEMSEKAGAQIFVECAKAVGL